MEVDEKLCGDLIEYHRSISELPSDEYYLLLALWVLHTYLLEKFQYSPMICLYAVPERGKSRTGKSLMYVAYRGLIVESFREAYIVRMAKNFQVSLFFDVKDAWQKAEQTGSEDILLHRFEQGAVVPRVEHPDRPAFSQISYYEIHGATILGSNEDVHKILGTRCITINMPESSRTFDTDVTPEQGLALKERLVAFRAKFFMEALPEIPKPAAGRLGDILRPLLQVLRLVNPEAEGTFYRLVEELQKKRGMEKSESIEGQVLRAILNNRNIVDKGVLPISVITEEVNRERTTKFQFTSQRIGKIVTALGFDRARMSDGKAAIIWDDNKIEIFKKRYDISEPSVTSVTSELLTRQADVTDVPDLSEYLRGKFLVVTPKEDGTQDIVE